MKTRMAMTREEWRKQRRILDWTYRIVATMIGMGITWAVFGQVSFWHGLLAVVFIVALRLAFTVTEIIVRVCVLKQPPPDLKRKRATP